MDAKISSYTIVTYFLFIGSPTDTGSDFEVISVNSSMTDRLTVDIL